MIIVCSSYVIGVVAAGFASESEEVSADVIRRAFLATEEEFLSLVRQQWSTNPQMASVGTCCLVGVICNGVLHVANAGDSRAVLGRADKSGRGVTAVQLSTEHNASFESVRNELRTLHPDDPHIVVSKHKVWRVKGIIQVTNHLCISSSLIQKRCGYQDDNGAGFLGTTGIKIHWRRLSQEVGVQQRTTLGQIQAASTVQQADSQRRTVSTRTQAQP